MIRVAMVMTQTAGGLPRTRGDDPKTMNQIKGA